MIKMWTRHQKAKRDTFAILATFMMSFPLGTIASPMPDTTHPLDIYYANSLLSRTINIGFTLDAPVEGAWGHTLKEQEFKAIKNAGFTAIRLPVQWVARMDSVAPYLIDNKFIARVDWAVKEALKNKLAIILDNHLDEQLMAHPAEYKERFLRLWSQLAQHYQSWPQQVMFEIMAEPHGALEKVWEEYFLQALQIIRQKNPARPVLVGPVLYNLPYKINSLHLPPQDKYIIAAVHLYHPVQFTMQGEAWFPVGEPMKWLGTKWGGTDSEKAEIIQMLDRVSSWATLQGKPVFLGEFGVTDHADLDSRIAWITFYCWQAERHHFSWGFWNFGVDYSLFDIKTNTWRTELLNALIPPQLSWR